MNTFRPCRCDNVRRGEPYARGRDCPHCWQFHHLEAFNLAWGGDGTVVPVVAPPVPAVRRGVGTHLKLLLAALGLDESSSCSCESWRARMDAWGPAECRARRAEIEVHLRAEARKVGWGATLKAGAKAIAAGLVLNPLDPAPGLLAEAVRRAEAEAPPAAPPPATNADPWLSPVVVPEPPPYTGAGGRLALVTIAANDKGRQLLEVSGPLMERYARRIGATFVVLDWPGPAAWPMGCKFALGPVVAAYERTIYADADVLFRPGCLDLFGQVPPDAVGGVDDWWSVGVIHLPFHVEYRRFLAAMGFAVPPAMPWYLNTGVLVLPRAAAPLLAVPDRPIPPLWCSEQHLWNARFQASGIPVHVLPPRCNYQWWANEKAGYSPPPGAVLHFSGPTGAAEKLPLMLDWVGRGVEHEPDLAIPDPAAVAADTEPEPEPLPVVDPTFDPCDPPPIGRIALRRGMTREVLLVGPWAVKVPTLRSWRLFVEGVLANLNERRRSGLDPRLCPVLFALWGGLLLVMRRAEPLHPDIDLPTDFGALPVGEPFPPVPLPDVGPRNLGRLDGRPVIVDYGW
ncbi:MAG TPA: hypothetical protein VD866_16985 [Urbifossiella sp.]|nr:hypothetical protein [Urbifossiella sp.]